MDKFVVSVAGSGTIFLGTRLGSKGNIHSSAEWNSILERVEGFEIITPLRDPKRVWESWCKRWRKKPSVPLAQFYASWFQLHALSLVREVDFINIEAQTDPRITDWSPVNASPFKVGEYEVQEIDLGPIYRLPFVASSFSLSS